MADASLTVAPNESQNMGKVFDTAIKGIEKTKAAAAEFGKEGNILTRIYGTQEQATKVMSIQEKLEKQLETKTVVMDRLTKKMKEYWQQGDASKWEAVRGRLQTVTKEYDNINLRLEEGNQLLEDREQLEAKKPSMLDQLGIGSSEGGITGRIRGASSAASKLGFGEDLTGTIDKIGDLVEELGSFDEQLGGVKDTILSAAKAGMDGKSGFAAVTGALKGGMSGIGEAAGAAVTAIGPLGVGMIALSVSMTALDLLSEGYNKAIEKEIELRQKNVDTQLEFQDLVETGNSESLASQKRILEGEIKIKQAAFDAAAQSEIADDSFIGGVNKYRTVAEAALNEILGRGVEVTNIYGANAGDAKKYAQEIADAQKKIEQIDKAEKLVAEKEAEAKATDNLTKAQEDHISALEELAQAEKDYSKQVSDFQKQQERDHLRQLEDMQISDSRATKQHEDEIARIKTDSAKSDIQSQKDHDKQILSLKEDQKKAELEAEQGLLESIAQINDDLAKTISQNQKDFNESQAEAQRDHNKSVARAEAQYEKERLQRIKDAGRAQLDAELNNDVNAFIAAQQSAQDDLEKMAQDHQDQKKQDEEDYRESQQRSKEQFDKQQAQAEQQAKEAREQAQINFDKEKAQREKALKESIEQEDKALKEKLEAEKESLRESLRQNKESWDEQQRLQKEDRDLAERRRKEDLDLQLKDMEENFRDQTKAIQKRDDAALDIIAKGGKVMEQSYTEREAAVRQIVTSSYQTLVNDLKAIQASTIWSSSSSGGGSSSGSSSSSYFGTNYSGNGSSNHSSSSFFNRSSRTGGFGRSAVLAAEGAIVGPHKPTLIIAGEGDEQEIVMPLTKSAGIQGSFGQQQSLEVHYHGSITIGDGVSEQVFRQEMENLSQGIVDGLSQSRDSGGAP